MPILDRAYAYRKGALLAKATGGTLEFQGDPLPADTIAEELAGVTPVPKHAILSMDLHVSQTGDELDVVQQWLDTEELTWKVQLAGSGKLTEAKGYLMAPSLKWGAAEHTMLSVKVLMKASAFQ